MRQEPTNKPTNLEVLNVNFMGEDLQIAFRVPLSKESNPSIQRNTIYGTDPKLNSHEQFRRLEGEKQQIKEMKKSYAVLMRNKYENWSERKDFYDNLIIVS